MSPATATSGAVSASATVAVQQAVTVVRVSPSSLALSGGDTARISATALDAQGNEVPDARFEWSSSDAAIATVDGSGLVHAGAVGGATIIAMSGALADSSHVSCFRTIPPIITRRSRRACRNARHYSGWDRGLHCNGWHAKVGSESRSVSGNRQRKRQAVPARGCVAARRGQGGRRPVAPARSCGWRPRGRGDCPRRPGRRLSRVRRWTRRAFAGVGTLAQRSRTQGSTKEVAPDLVACCCYSRSFDLMQSVQEGYRIEGGGAPPRPERSARSPALAAGSR